MELEIQIDFAQEGNVQICLCQYH